MKKIIKIFSIAIVLTSLTFWGCEEKTNLTAPAPANTGTASFASFVTVGNSLTAGYQSAALFKTAQLYSFGNQIAKQVGAKFEQPLISDPGIGDPGLLEFGGLTKSGTPIIVVNQSKGTPLNLKYPKPYNNLGVPGALLYETLNTKDAKTSLTNNPFFDIILRGLGTQVQQALALHPTFMTLWIGNNDILGFATAGGVKPYTPPAQFTALYSTLLNEISKSGAKVVVANIPPVAAIPYFTTVGPAVGMSIRGAMRAGLAMGLFYQKHSELGIGTGLADTTALWTGKVLLTLMSSEYATLIGKPTGKFWSDHHLPLGPGIDTTKAFGLDPRNPFPNALVLDPDEIALTNSIISAYNNSIATLAAVKGYPVLDVNSFFSNVAKYGFQTNGLTFTTQFITGGLFGLDGVHPTSQGYAVIANEFIKVINSAYNASIPLIDVSTVPGSIQLSKMIKFNKYGIPIAKPGTFDHVMF